MSPAQAAAILVVPSFITNVWQCAGSQLVPLLRRMWPMLLGICAGIWGMRAWAGAGLLTASDSVYASIGLGTVLAVYAALGLSKVTFVVPEQLEPWLSPLTGGLTGAVTAVTGVYMIASAPYLQAIGLEKDDLVQSMGLSFTVSTLALAVLLIHDGALPTSVAGASVLALVPALIGMALGQWVRARARPDVFRICFFLATLLLGAHLILRALI